MRIPKITIHGRFQPPLHVNHRSYVLDAFDRADNVTILITNPLLSESTVKEADHRNKKENNPFTYEERVQIFEDYFDAVGIRKDRYEFKPFDITDETVWSDTLDRRVPNLVNVYGEWSLAKAKKFIERGYEVVRTDNPKTVPVSGTAIREILNKSDSPEDKAKQLIAIGYVPEAISGLFEILRTR